MQLSPGPFAEKVREFFGPRLRPMSDFHQRIAAAAANEGVGVVIIVEIPPGDNAPVEIRSYPWGTRVDVQGPPLGPSQ